LSASTHFLQGFLSLSDPVDLNFLKSSWMPFMLGTVFPGDVRQNLFSLTKHISLAEPHFTWFVQKSMLLNSILNHTDIHNNNQYLT
jgi:hypothetical protein